MGSRRDFKSRPAPSAGWPRSWTSSLNQRRSWKRAPEQQLQFLEAPCLQLTPLEPWYGDIFQIHSSVRRTFSTLLHTRSNCQISLNFSDECSSTLNAAFFSEPCYYRGKIIFLFFTRKFKSCVRWFTQSSSSNIRPVSTRIQLFFCNPPSSKAGPGSFVPKGKTSHGVLLKWLLFRIFQCLLGNRDHPITMRHLP